jgi:hypothetical protein
MKVIEKYLTMSVEEQSKDAYKEIMQGCEADDNIMDIVLQTIEYLNTEVEQAPLEELGWERIGNEVLQIQNGENYITLSLVGDELKAILEIMEGMK